MFTTSEIEASRALALQGYRIHDGYVWWIANDDPEQGLEEVRVGPAADTNEDTYWMLLGHGWPTNGPVLCQLCQDAESDLGGYCVTCQSMLNAEAAGEQAREAGEE